MVWLKEFTVMREIRKGRKLIFDFYKNKKMSELQRTN